MTETKSPEPSVSERLFVRPFAFGPGPGALAGFYKQLASLLRSGLPILRAFDTLEEQCSSGAIRRCLPLMRRHIEDGGTAAGAFALFPRIFDPVDVAMIRAGEQGGRLTDVLDRLFEGKKQFSGLIKLFVGSMLYSALILHAALFVMPFVEQLGREEPKPSYWSLALPNIAILYAALGVLVIAPRMMRQFQPSARLLDGVKMAVPIIGGATEKLAIARLARTLEGLYNSGLSLLEALPIGADACGNEVLRARTLRMVPLIESGEPLARAMKTVGGFPTAFVNMVATGEEGGNAAEMLRSAADYYGDEARSALQRLFVVLAVLIFLGVAAYVGFEIVKFYAGLFSKQFDAIKEIGL